MMQAIRIEDFVRSYNELRSSSVPPPIPRPSDVLVRVCHVGINYIDILYCLGKHQNNRSIGRPPFTLGLEFAGEVLQSPPNSEFKIGEKVFGAHLGSFAEQIAVPVHAIRRVPPGWTTRDAAGLAATAPASYGALVKIAHLQKGETVLVHAAAGGLGVVAVQVAKALGAKVIGTVGSESKASIVRRLGADHVLNYSQDGWEKRVLHQTGGRGVDVTFDSVGLVEKSVRCSAYGARILVVGFAGRQTDLERIPANRLLLKAVIIIGYAFDEYARHFPEHYASCWEGLNDLMSRHLLRPVVYDSENFSGLDSVHDAMKSLVERRIWGKASIEIANTSPMASKL